MSKIVVSSKTSTYSTAHVEQSLEEALQVIRSWPAWKIASMVDADSEVSQELIKNLLIVHNEIESVS